MKGRDICTRIIELIILIGNGIIYRPDMLKMEKWTDEMKGRRFQMPKDMAVATRNHAARVTGLMTRAENSITSAPGYQTSMFLPPVHLHIEKKLKVLPDKLVSEKINKMVR